MAERAPTANLLPEGLVWPLVGRAAELERVAGLRSAEDGRGVVLSGPAGVGKSRLAHDALVAADAEGAAVTRIRATRSAATVPLGAFAGVMPPGIRSDEPLELMRRSADALQERAAGRRVVLGVDDAQLLDPTSAALVLHLTEAGIAFVLATLRTGEPCPDAVQSLWKDAGAVRLDLQTLSEEDTGTLVEAVLQAPVEERARRWVYDGSRGNVLYIRELLLGALADGALREREGFWQLARRPPPSRSLTELVETRLSGLSPEERSAIELLALGEPLRLSEMVQLVGSDALAGVESRGLVRLDGPSAEDAVRAAHPLYAEVVRASMPVTRAHEARLRLAELVGARPDRSHDDALRVAHWLLDAGQQIPLELCLEASDAAIAAGAVELGGRLASLALEGGGGAKAALLLARCHVIYKRYDEAEAVLARAEPLQWTSRDTACDYLEQRSTLLYWGLQRPDEAFELLTRAQEWWPDEAWKRRLEPMRRYLDWLVHGRSASLVESESMLADPELEPGTRRGLEIVHCLNLFSSGRVSEACALALHLRPSLPLRTPTDEIAFDTCALIAAEAGEDTNELNEWLAAMLEDGARIDDHAAVGIAAYNLGEQRICEGRYVEAARLLAESITQFERRDPFGYLPLTLGSLAAVSYELGDLAAAELGMERYRAVLGDSAIPDMHLPYHARIQSRGLLAAGDPPAAQELLLEAAERCEGMPFFGIELRYHALRAGAPARTLVQAVTDLGPLSDARLSAAYVDHIRARAAADGALLLSVADEFAAMLMTRYAAEAAAHAAEAFAAEGRQDSARRAATRCRELHDLGQGGRLPEMRGIDADSVVLSPREAQLVDLAARGLTNAEIADRLVLSVRTVESHIYRAMQKLGVNDRRELPTRVS